MAKQRKRKSEEKTQYILAPTVSPEQIKNVRQQLGLTQKAFADLLKVSEKTIERWESGNQPVSGPIVALLNIFEEYPELEQHMKIPERSMPLRLWYMHQDHVCSIIDVDEHLRRVKVYNFTDNLFYRAFGKDEHPSYEKYEEFLESRCFPESRDKLKLELEHLI